MTQTLKLHRKKNHALAAAGAASLLALAALLAPGQARAQYVVHDPANFIQNSITAVNQAASYTQQGYQYKLQAQQYQAQTQNLQALDKFQWADASRSLNQLVGTVNGSTGAYQTFLSQYQTQDQWSQHPPTASTYRQSTANASATEIAAYAATVKNLSKQNDSMARDAAQLSQMTASAQGSAGQLQALQAGAQLASAQTAQLQEIRALMVHLADATAARNASLANREAAEAAATQNSLQGNAGEYNAAAINMSMR